MAVMKLQAVFDEIGGNLDELNTKIKEAAEGGDTIKRKFVITDFSLAPTTQFAGLAVGEMATFTAAADAVGRPWGESSTWGYVARTHADYYFLFANRVNGNEVAYRSSDSANAGTWKAWVIDDGSGVAASAVKLATARRFSISGGATAAAQSFDGSGAVDLAVTGLDMGTANAGTLPVARGGTGMTTLASGQVLVGGGAGAVTTRAIATEPASGASALLTAGGAFTALSNKVSIGIPILQPLVFQSGISTMAGKASGYYIDHTGRVFLQVFAEKMTGFAHAEVIAALPVGFRPPARYAGAYGCGTLGFSNSLHRPLCNISINEYGEIKLQNAETTPPIGGATTVQFQFSFLSIE